MSPRRLLGFLVLNFLVAGIGLHFFTTYLYGRQRIPLYCVGTVIHPLHEMVARRQKSDSWGPMLQALNARSSASGIYQTVFFKEQTKFQYPLASLIPFAVLRAAGFSDYRISDTMKWLSILAFMAQVPCLFFIITRAFREPQSLPLRLGMATILVISFYPLSRAYELGQIQIFLDLLFTVAFLCWIEKKDGAAGFLIGVSVLVKPQYGLFVLWGVIRNRWRFVAGACLPLASGLLLAVALYGWKNNIQYVNVIQYMSRHGEAYFPNQSVNGLMNRLWQNASTTTFNVHGFAPFLPVIYLVTILSSLAIVALALINRAPQSEGGRVSEFGLMAIAATAASPIAWEHHYGVLLPLFALVLPQAAESGKRWKSAIVPLIAFVLCADDWRVTNLAAGMSPLNIVESTVLCGAFILFFYLRKRVRLSGTGAVEKTIVHQGISVDCNTYKLTPSG